MAREVSLERVELGPPEAAVAAQPAIQLGDALAAQRVHAALAVGGGLDQTRLLEDLEVARHRRLGDAGQHRHQVARGRGALEEAIEQRAPARVGDGGEDVHAPTYNDQII
jgi:hypothetical protein